MNLFGVRLIRTERTILHRLDGDVEGIFRQHAAQLSKAGVQEEVDALPVVAIDGKTLRHSFDAFLRTPVQ